MIKWGITVVLLLASLINMAWGDIIHLKNGRSFEGTITEESDNQVTIQEQDLNLTFHHSRIARIEKKALPPPPPPRETTKDDAGPGTTPRAFEGFYDELRKLDASEIVTQRAKSQVVKISRTLTVLRNQEKQLENEQRRLRDLATNARTVSKHNEHMIASNAMLSKIENKRKEFNALNAKLRKTRQSINAYSNQASQTQQNYQERLNRYMEGGPSQFDSRYFAYIKKKMEKHRGAFKSSFQFYNGSSLVVRAQLNQKGFGTFIVDTGASMVTIHRALANKLQIPLETAPIMQASLADGSISEMPSIVFSTINVNGMTAFDVNGAVSENPPSEGIDGLLGMSFLAQFDFKLDVQRGRLILNRR